MDIEALRKLPQIGLSHKTLTQFQEWHKKWLAKRSLEKKTEATPGAGTVLRIADPSPWPEPVDGASLLSTLVVILNRYLALVDGAAEAIALWILFAHCHDAFDVSPILAITSPEKRCGKTTALSLVGSLVPRPLSTSNITTAALFRAVEKYGPTLLVDEADSFLADNEELRGILNSGHTRDTAFVVRTIGDNYEVVLFRTWGPKAVALIGNLSGTLEDRSVLIPMHRKPPGDQKERLRLDRPPELADLRRQAAQWAQDNVEAVRKADPETPSGLHDRASDNGRPLLAIADLAGREWSGLARKSARMLSGGEQASESAAVFLLEDLRDLFSNRRAEKLRSEKIVEALAAMEERPWPEWRRGRPITPRQLASLLGRFGITPRTVKFPDGTTAKGYHRDWFSEAWARYLPAPNDFYPSPASPPAKTLGETAFLYPSPDEAGDGSKNGSDLHKYCMVTEVTDRNPQKGEEEEVIDLDD